MNKEITLEDIKHMVAYVIDTNDQKLIEEYALALRQMRVDAKDGIKYTYPTVEVLDKIYYGNEVEIKDNKIYVDGVDTGLKEIKFDGNLKIGGNKIGGNVDYVKISGDLVANETINAAKLFTNKLVVHGNINIDGSIHCDDISIGGDLIANGRVSCDDIYVSGNVKVDGKLSADDINPSK